MDLFPLPHSILKFSEKCFFSSSQFWIYYTSIQAIGFWNMARKIQFLAATYLNFCKISIFGGKSKNLTSAVWQKDSVFASNIFKFLQNINIWKKGISGQNASLLSRNVNFLTQKFLEISINSHLQSTSESVTRNLVKFNTSKIQLLTISLSNTPSNYQIIFEDSKIPPLNSIKILGLQTSSSLSWRDHICYFQNKININILT